MPKISVIMPVYNSEKYLDDAIKSILNQTFSDFELIIIDDNSTDDSAKIIKSYNDKRIRYYKNKKNSGVAITLNNGLKKAKGKYIARMDSDDISIKTRFFEQIKLMKKYDVVSSNIIFIDENNKNIGYRKYLNNIDKIIKIESPLAHPTVMFKKELIDKHGFYNEKLTTSQDYDLWIRFYLKNAKFHIINKELLKYRIHKNSVKTINIKKILKNTINIKLNAKKAGLKLGLIGYIRLLLEILLLLIPRKILLWLFYLIKKK